MTPPASEQAATRLGRDRPRLVLVEGLNLSLPLDPFLDLTALSTYSGLSRRKLQDLLKDPFRPLPHYRIGGKILVRRGDFDTWALHYRRVGHPDVDRIVEDVLAGLSGRSPHERRSLQNTT